jgi:hypothetical protein
MKKLRPASMAAMFVIGLLVATVTYVASIGPVYYCWAAFSANMGTHSKIEWFYSPLLERIPVARDYRDVSRIAGHDRHPR